jgi:hypothetical protein
MATKFENMKQRLTLIVLVLLHCSQALAQDEPKREPRIIVQPDRWEDKIIIEITNDMWLNLPAGVELRPFSPGFKAYFFTDYQFGESVFSFAWGFGVSADNVHSNADWVLTRETASNPGSLVLTPYPDEYDYSKNKFVTTYLELPIEFRLITEGRRPFKFATGFRLGYQVQNHNKIIDDEGKRKFYNFDYIEKLRYGVSARMGYGRIGITGFYSLVPLVDEKNGSDVIPVSLGLYFTPIR